MAKLSNEISKFRTLGNWQKTAGFESRKALGDAAHWRLFAIVVVSRFVRKERSWSFEDLRYQAGAWDREEIGRRQRVLRAVAAAYGWD